ARRHNYLAGIAEAGSEMGLAWLDLSTGVFALTPTSETALGGDLARLMPGEIVVPERLLARPALFELFAEWKPALTPLANPRFDSEAARRRLESFYGVRALDGFGNFGRAEIAAAGALVDYIALTQQGGAAYLAPPQRVAQQSVMQIDAATRRNLELTVTLSGERRGSLLATIDRSLTGAGARLLAEHLAAPLTDPAAIAARLDAVQFLLDRADTRAGLRERLRRVPDIERALTRLSLGRGGPRDLAALRDALGQTAAIRVALAAPGLVPLPALLAAAETGLGEHAALVDRLARALAAELPLFARDGGFIAAAAAALAALDLAASHAECAGECGWTRPEIVADPVFEVRGGRHPTVEAALAGKAAFVANDCVLEEDRIWLVTGPNMAGKSIF